MEDSVELDISPKVRADALASLKSSLGAAFDPSQDALKRIGMRLQSEMTNAMVESMTGEKAKRAAVAQRKDAHEAMLSSRQVAVGGAGQVAQGLMMGSHGIGSVTSGIGSALSSMGPHGAMAGQAVGAAGMGLQAALGAVGKANPHVVEEFDAALDDVTGVIGKSLTPAIQALTPFVRLFGDLLASVLPTQEQMAIVLEPIPGIVKELREAFDPLIPVIQDLLLVALQQAAVWVKIFAEVAKAAIKTITFGAFTGGGDGSNIVSSFGAAHRGPAHFMGASELNKGAIAGAFSSGSGSVEDRQLEAQKQMLETLKEINSTLRRQEQDDNDVGGGGDF